MEKSLPSAIKLNPDELIIGLDYPESQRIMNKACRICNELNFKNIRIISAEKNPDWNFQLANLIWKCYNLAKNDIILSFDVDSILRKEVLLGLDQIGHDNIAVVSFTKKLRIKTLGELVRYVFYRLRVKQSDYVFSGVYWIYRPFYFANIELEKYMKIYNGVDTIMCEQILEKNTHKIITRKEKGVNALSPQNEDLPWRQYQTGVWLGANEQYFKINRLKRIEKRKQDFVIRKKMSLERARDTKSRLARIARLKLAEIRIKLAEKYINNKIEASPIFYVLVKTIVYWHPYLLLGYMFAKKNPENEAVMIAKTMKEMEWGYTGSKYLNHKKWKKEGTGFVK
jgi:hypothetical protein